MNKDGKKIKFYPNKKLEFHKSSRHPCLRKPGWCQPNGDRFKIGTSAVLVDKHSRTNLAIDLEFGDKSSGFYLSASETF